MAIREEDALLSQPIDIRRLDFLCPVTAHIRVTQVICHDEEDVGKVLLFFACA
jgi:hypothetical protein